MKDTDIAWEEFIQSGKIDNKKNAKKEGTICPKCREIYISTQTKIAFLNQTINLNELFWLIKIGQRMFSEEKSIW